MNIQNMINEKETFRKELIERSKASEDVQELRSINAQLDEVNKDIANLRSLLAEQVEAEKRNAEKRSEDKEDDKDDKEDDKKKDDKQSERSKAVNAGEVTKRSADFKQGAGFEERAKFGKADNAEMEKRGKAIKEARTVTVATTGIIIPHRDSNTIGEPFNTISSLVDNVGTITFDGGESYRQPFAIDTPAGDYTGEGEEYNTAESTFGQVSINKSKLTAIADYSEELEKLPAAPYAEYVQNGVRESLRRKLTQEILIGDGSAGHLVGIFSNKVATADTDSVVPVIDKDKDLAIDKIDDTTLDTIVFNYGGDENVEGAQVLILNKMDLLEFAKVRTSNKQRFYDIVSNGNYGTINGVPYIINSACKAVTGTNTKAGDFCMAYGNLKNYTLATFSPVDIKKSYDSKFREGMVSVRGSVFVGGNVTRQNGFVRIKKAGKTSSGTQG
ncbi:putative phage major capsid protein [Selenomonas ruminantium subsp. lactilytica TAM6421]|uniref:Putative phage major capsid protein n=1 Tax=Selenomonas ruminantium subsp. lactilytica (strain NBRC 103574 / TAM6421) TaxID=927704 RepID=I0GRZ0_SELRL|nr:phage major capsid protein [Selenomonas ruminantium]BAL83527.1 putative phage major capsid protein [Selenomonas ruminantium subsp. lactilytica TAM6421]